MIELKPCPFCGGKASLKKVINGYVVSPTTKIIDEWKVICENKCCSTYAFKDEIYHADNGEIIVEHNGAIEAVEAWNKRSDKPANYCTHYCKHCKYAISRPAYNEAVGAYTDYVCSLETKDGAGK